MVDFLCSHNVNLAAMEAISIYLGAQFKHLEGAGFEVLFSNHRSLKWIPGLKTDVKDINRLGTLGLMILVRHPLCRPMAWWVSWNLFGCVNVQFRTAQVISVKRLKYAD
jgi:hypothetical protein